MNNSEFIVEASFPLFAKWTLKNPATKPKAPAPVGIGNLRDRDPMEQYHYQAALTKYEALPAAMVIFAPKDQELGRLIEDAPGFDLLFHEISLPILEKAAPIFDQADYDERKRMLSACTNYHFLRIRNAGQFIVIGDPGVRFLPGKSWNPKGGSNSKGTGASNGRRSRGRKKVKPISQTKRREASFLIRCITLNPEDENPTLGMQSTCSRIIAGAERFKRGLTLTFPNAQMCVVGDNLNPREPLTKAFDPDLGFLCRDKDGHNVLTNFRGISIPLLWPDWSDERLNDLKSLQYWTERSYEGFISFLEGMHLDSLDDFIPSENSPVERIASDQCTTKRCSNRDRKGQCYRGDYEKLSVIGPYFLFEVKRNDVTFYILDSPFYGIALRGYPEKQDALDYISGGDLRTQAESRALWPKLCHDPDMRWLDLLERRIESIPLVNC